MAEGRAAELCFVTKFEASTKTMSDPERAEVAQSKPPPKPIARCWGLGAMPSPIALRVFNTLVLLAVFAVTIYQWSSVESKLSHLVDDFGSMSVNDDPSTMSAPNGASLHTTKDVYVRG
jgi:hypothetical protein